MFSGCVCTACSSTSATAAQSHRSAANPPLPPPLPLAPADAKALWPYESLRAVGGVCEA